MEKILQQILGELKTNTLKLDSLESKVNKIESTVINLESKMDKIEIKLESVYDQTANLTEFTTSTSYKLDKLNEDVEFMKYEGLKTKQDLFTIKRNLKSIKQ